MIEDIHLNTNNTNSIIHDENFNERGTNSIVLSMEGSIYILILDIDEFFD